jgi:hypothetical protein
MKRKCEEAKTPYNGLKLEADTELEIANIEGNEWMLPIELDSIKRELEFVEEKDDDATCAGYLNPDGEPEGAYCVTICESGGKECGEMRCG